MEDIILTVKNSFTYVSKHFNLLPKKIQNKFVRELSYLKKSGQFDYISNYLFVRSSAEKKDLLEYYQFPTGLLHRFWNLAKENDIKLVLKDKRGSKPSALSVSSFFNRLSKINPELEIREHQVSATNKCLKRGRGLVEHSTSAGKCFGKDTPILMFDGSIKSVQDIVVGDQLMGPDSKPKKVLSLASGKEMMYRITSSRNESHVVNKSHVISLKFTNFPAKSGVYCGGKRFKTGDIANVKLTDYLKAGARFRNMSKLWKTGVNFKGVLEPPTDRYKFKKTDKDIPEEYKTASMESRLETLASILDTKGFYNSRTSAYSIIIKSENLMDDFIFIVRSCGFYVKKNILNVKVYNKANTYRFFSCTVSGDIHKIPCRVLRKKAVHRKKRTDPMLSGIKSIEEVGIDNYYGFTVDGDGLLMLGDFTVTHNTVVISALIYCLGTKTLVLCKGIEHVRQLSREIQMYTDGNVGIYGKGNFFSSPTIIANTEALNAFKNKNLNGFITFMKEFKMVIGDECFIPRTKIKTSYGETLIEAIKVGDKIIAWDEENKKQIEAKVTRVFINKTNTLYRIRAKDNKIICTGNHPIMTKKGWVKAKDIKINTDEIQCVSVKNKPKFRKVENIDILKKGISGEFERRCPKGTVYNIEVENFHTYIANNIVVHNCHFAGAVTYKQCFYYATNARYRFGFSGTMHREDGAFLEVEAAIGKVIDKIDYSYLQKKGYIVPAKFHFIDPLCDRLYGEENLWPDCLKIGIVENSVRNKWIAKICNVYIKKGKQVLIISPFRTEHGHVLEKEMESFRFIHGKSSSSDRESALKEFKEKKFMVLMSTTLYDTVINLPDVRCVILAGGGKAQNSLLQRIGRGIRKAKGKSHVDIIVPWDSHSVVLLKHSKTLKGFIEKVDVWKEQLYFGKNNRKNYRYY